MAGETPAAREVRHRRRRLFDEVALAYDAARPACPAAVVEVVAATAGLHRASRVLEVGCGTGQLTAHLARRAPALEAIDIGPSMIATARRRLAGTEVELACTSFEDLDAEDGSFDLIVAADAYHWLDPGVRARKSARLLGPRGWLAVVSTEQRYDEPLGSALRRMWVARSADGGAWLRAPGPTVAEELAATGLFGPACETTYVGRRTLPAASLLALEATRAAALDWDDRARQVFAAELRACIGPATAVPLTERARLTMAPLPRSS